MKATLLRNLRVKRVDLVDAGANYDVASGEGSHVMLYKRRDRATVRRKLARIAKAVLGGIRDAEIGTVWKLAFTAAIKGYADGEAMTVAEAIEDQEERELLSALWQSLDTIFNDDTLDETQQAGMVQQSLDQFMAALTANDETAAGDATVGKSKEKSMKLDLSKASPEIKAHVEKLEADLAAANAAKVELEKKAAPAGDGKEDVLKGLSPEARALVEKSQADAAAASAEVKKLRDEQTEREFVEKAKGLRALPGIETTKLGKLMKSLSEQAPEAFKELEPLLKSWNEVIAKSPLFKELGSSGAGEGTSAHDVAKARGKELLEKGEVKTLEQGIAKAYERDPKLYEQHRAEQKGRN